MRNRQKQRALRRAGIRREEPVGLHNEEHYMDTVPHEAVEIIRNNNQEETMERMKYKFLFRCAGMDPVMVIRETRPGDAENCARRIAKAVAKKYGADEVACVWMGPAETRIPEAIRKELCAS